MRIVLSLAVLALATAVAGCPSSTTRPPPPGCEPVDVAWVDTAPRCGDPARMLNQNTVASAITPGCQVLDARVELTYAPLVAAPDLRGVRAVTNTIAFFQNRDLVDLTGLSTLELIGGDLQLRDNPGVTSLRDLQRLHVVRAALIVRATGVASLEGLEQLREVGQLTITENAQLTSLRGLSGLCRIGDGGLYLYRNPLLPESEVQELLGRVEITGPILRQPPTGA